MARRWATVRCASSFRAATRVPLGILLAVNLLVGCKTDVAIDPQVAPAPNSAKIPMAVGVFYGPELRASKLMTDGRLRPYDIRNDDDLKLIEDSALIDSFAVPVGKASVSLFQGLFSSVFESVVEIDSKPTLVHPRTDVDAVIEPRIEALRLRSSHVGFSADQRFWADVRYRLMVYGADGGEITSWTVPGNGTSGDKYPFDDVKRMGRTIEEALEIAGARIMASFEESPEAVRWRRGESTDSATATATGQVTQFETETSDAPIRGAYPQIVAVSADPHRPPDVASEGIDADPRDAGVHSFMVTIDNLGSERLLFRRSEVALVFSNDVTVKPLPGMYLATALTNRKKRLYLSGSPGPPGMTGAIVSVVMGLFSGLSNYAAGESETAEATVYGLVFKKSELTDAYLDEGDRISGYLHFRLPRIRRPIIQETATLIVPVVQLDTVTRYVISLPLSERDLWNMRNASK